MSDFRIAAAGDSALLIEFPAHLDPTVNEAAIALGRAVEQRVHGGLRDVVVGYCSVTLYFDPLQVDPVWLESEVRRAADSVHGVPDTVVRDAIDVPVCYGGEFGPDLAEVAAFGRCEADEVIALHAAAEYRVYLLGFVPGFPYMAEVDARIAKPRRATPRTAVPAGAVAIAGRQTGIYPLVTPGGWNIIGRTPVRLFDVARPEPFLFRAGDRVRFRRITRVEFDRTAA
jgi:inhibitor of KinA